MRKPLHPITAIVLLLFLGAIVMDATKVSYVPDMRGSPGGSMVVGLILASPIFGLMFLIYRFVRWHGRFHRRMKEPRR